ncbi:MAG: contractile injection system tape measure protein [Bacteroidales bacterium]|nr:contractile injection system tape measure protein [Bacteroidales bacterium]
MNNQNQTMSQGDFILADNAGIVLLAPYFPRLFSMLSFLDEGHRKLRGKPEQAKAFAVLYYIVAGRDCMVTEHEGNADDRYGVNKLLTGMEISEPIPELPEITKEEREVCESLLKGVLSNWDKLRNTSIATLREAFLMRPGKIDIKEDFIRIVMEQKAYDLLIESIPWNFRMIRFPWMEKHIEVRWR